MRSILSCTALMVLIGAGFAAAADGLVPPPATPPVTPTPPAPVVAASGYASFDTGLGASFIAEPNTFRAWRINPADFNLFATTFIGGNIGGDLSLGGFSYSRNGGAGKPGPADPDEHQEGVDISYLAGVGGTALGAYRRDALAVGGQALYDYTRAQFGYNGGGLTLPPFFTTDEGFSRIRMSAQTYSLAACGSWDFQPHVIGLSCAYNPEKAEGDYDYEFIPEGNETYSIAEMWGRRELSDIHAKVGYALRPGGDWDIGGAAGYRLLENHLQGRDYSGDESALSSDTRNAQGEVRARGQGFTLDGAGRYLFWGKLRIGGMFHMQRLAGVTVDYNCQGWDKTGPFGEYISQDFRLAEGDEMILRGGGGVAVYPDERTTIAFDYGYNRLSASANLYRDQDPEFDKATFAAYHTYTQLGAERWVLDNFAVRAGWGQNLFGTPRTVWNAGLSYKFDDNWFVSYDYRGDQLTLQDLSVFVPLNEVIKPASHRFTVIRYL